MGRATQGVRLINIKDSDSIAAVAKVAHDEDAEEGLEEGAENETENGTENESDTTENQE